MLNADGSKTLRLKKTVKLGSEEIAELTIREPVAKDLRKLSGNPSTSELLDLAARLANQAPSVIDQLCMRDTKELLEIVGNFMEPGPETGETDSEA